MIGTFRRLAVTTVWLTAVATLLLSTGVAWAAPEGRIQQVESTPGVIDFVFSAEGLAEGESIDPASVGVTIAGVEAPATATSISESAVAPARTVMLTLDASGSMADFGKLAIAKSAAASYLDTLPADVKAGLVSFSDTAEVEVAPTVDRAAVKAAIDSLDAKGGTALNDAVILTSQALGAEGSRNVVLLSDGNDADSQASGKEARAVLAESGVILDAVSLGEGSQEKSLAAFAKAGNGSVVTATNADALTAAFESAARSVENQLAVRAGVPDGVEAGTVELTAAALVGTQPITDSAATIITPAPEPSASATDEFGAVAVPEGQVGIFDQPLFLLVVIGAIFLALAAITSLAVGAVDTRNRKEGRVARRLEEVSSMGQSTSAAQVPASTTSLGEGTAVRSLVSFADRVAASRDTSMLARKLEEASVSLRPSEWIIVHALIAILAGLLTTLLTDFNLLLAALAFLVGLIAPWVYLGYRASARRKEFYSALPDAMQMLSGSLSAGYSLPQALDNVAREAGGPMGEELNRALLETRLGLPIDEALEGVAQRMQSPDFHWIVMAIRINRQVGGNLAEVLTNVGMTLRERERLRRQVKALSAEGVLSGWILGSLPFVLGFTIILLNPAYILPLFTTPLGWVLLGAGAVLYVIGVLWMRNLVKLEI